MGNNPNVYSLDWIKYCDLTEPNQKSKFNTNNWIILNYGIILIRFNIRFFMEEFTQENFNASRVYDRYIKMYTEYGYKAAGYKFIYYFIILWDIGRYRYNI